MVATEAKLKTAKHGKPVRMSVGVYTRTPKTGRKNHVRSWSVSELSFNRLAGFMDELVAHDHELQAAALRKRAAQQKSDASPSIPGNTPTQPGSATPVSKPTGSSPAPVSVSATPAPARAGAATVKSPANGKKPTANGGKPSKAQPAQRRAGANLQGSARPA